MIGLKQLIQIASYTPEAKEELLGKLGSLSDQQKSDLENLTWNLIREEYENKVAFETEKAIVGMADGSKKFGDTDLQKIENDIFNELVTKIQGINTQKEIAEVRQKIQEQTAKSS